MKLNDSINVLGQLPGLNIYTQISLCFAVTDPSSHPTIVDTLRKGLERLSVSFPWIAGQIVNEGSGEGNTGTFMIRPFEKTPRLVVKDLRNEPSTPTMDALREASFPFRMLDETIIAPRMTIPGTSGETGIESSPVFLLQANFITGGLILTFVGQHNAMDMTGQGHLIHLFSKACRNEEFTSEELTAGNLASHNIVPLLDSSYEPGPELDHLLVKPKPSLPVTDDHAAPTRPPESTWAYFSFDPQSLTTLKSFASKSLSSGYISTDDAVTAFVWQSVARARLPRIGSTAKSQLTRAVNVRRYLGISELYPALVQSMAFHSNTVEKLVEEPLGGVASLLRSAVDPKTSSLAHTTRAVATFLDQTPDKSVFSLTATIDGSSDLMYSSWTKVNCYELDFNLGLGKPEAVRRPQFIPFEGLIYSMPKRLDGEISVGICLRNEDMERLKADEEFVKYGRYIG